MFRPVLYATLNGRILSIFVYVTIQITRYEKHCTLHIDTINKRCVFHKRECSYETLVKMGGAHSLAMCKDYTPLVTPPNEEWLNTETMASGLRIRFGV